MYALDRLGRDTLDVQSTVRRLLDHGVTIHVHGLGAIGGRGVPMLAETRDVLARIKARHAAYMAKQRPDRRKPLPETVLRNSYWEPWTPKGFGSRFNDAKQDSKIDRRLHDVRGTFATRCMIAGLTDDEIANILGWATKDVARIRAKYVSSARVPIAIGERLAAAKSA